MRLLCLYLTFGIALSSLADEVTIETVDGKKYENVTISRRLPDGVTVISDTGVEKIPFAKMTSDSKTKLGYDPAKEAAALDQSAQILLVKATAIAKEGIWIPWKEHQKKLEQLYVSEPVKILQLGGSANEARAATETIAAALEKHKQKFQNTRNLVDILRTANVDESRISEMTNSILEEKVSIGMPRAAVLLAWGEPDSNSDHISQYGTTRQWGYKKGKYDWTFVHFDKELVTSISD